MWEATHENSLSGVIAVRSTTCGGHHFSFTSPIIMRSVMRNTANLGKKAPRYKRTKVPHFFTTILPLFTSSGGFPISLTNFFSKGSTDKASGNTRCLHHSDNCTCLIYPLANTERKATLRYTAAQQRHKYFSYKNGQPSMPYRWCLYYGIRYLHI